MMFTSSTQTSHLLGSNKSTYIHTYCSLIFQHSIWASLAAQMVKNLPAM